MSLIKTSLGTDIQDLARECVRLGISYEDAEEAWRREIVGAFLMKADGNQSLAAETMGVHRNTMARAMQEFGFKVRWQRRPKAERKKEDVMPIDTDSIGSFDHALFDHALAISARVHYGQKDKAGEPYILHPVRVAVRVRPAQLRVIAVLHDVLEDCDEAIRFALEAEIGNGLGSFALSGVQTLSRRGGEDYQGYIDRLSRIWWARKVKLADIEDNLDERRHAESGWKQPVAMRQRYIWAKWFLERADLLDDQTAAGSKLCKTPTSETIESAAFDRALIEFS